MGEFVGWAVARNVIWGKSQVTTTDTSRSARGRRCHKLHGIVPTGVADVDVQVIDGMKLRDADF